MINSRNLIYTNILDLTDRYYCRYIKDVKSGYIFLQIGKVTLNNERDLRSKGDHKTSY